MRSEDHYLNINDAYLHPGKTAVCDAAISLAGKKRIRRVLDIGCGTGISLEYINKKTGAEVFGVDLSERALDIASERVGEGEFIPADAEGLPFDDDLFDLVISECVMTLPGDPEKALKEAVRVTAPGGFLIISALADRDCLSECLKDTNSIFEKKSLVKEDLMDPACAAEIIAGCGMKTVFIKEMREELISYYAEIIFEYGSVKNYAESVKKAAGADPAGCGVDFKKCTYFMLAAEKQQ